MCLKQSSKNHDANSKELVAYVFELFFCIRSCQLFFPLRFQQANVIYNKAMDLVFFLGFNYLLHLYCALILFAFQLAFHIPLVVVGNLYSVTLQPVINFFFNDDDRRYKGILEMYATEGESKKVLKKRVANHKIQPGEADADEAKSTKVSTFEGISFEGNNAPTTITSINL